MFRTGSYFTVFGASYVPEHHIEHYRFDSDPNARFCAPTIAAVWVVPCALIAGISVFAAQIAYLTGVL
jgi:hypothetical protein